MEVLTRWLAAMRDPDTLGDVATDDLRVARYAPVKRGTMALAPAAVFQGVAAVQDWLRRTPKPVAFEYAPEPPLVEGDTITIGYIYRVEDWSNTGVWVLRIAGDRIAEVWHRPDALPEPEGEPRLRVGSRR